MISSGFGLMLRDMQVGARVIITTALLMIMAPADAQVFSSSAGDIKVETVARGLEYPWSLAFLPNNRMLITERPGRMRIVTRMGELSAPLAGVPNVVAQGQAGLMDVVIDRDYPRNSTIYFCFNATINGDVAVARAQLIDGSDPRLEAVKVIFRQDRPATSGGTNNACRIAQDADGKLFVTLGDHADDWLRPPKILPTRLARLFVLNPMAPFLLTIRLSDSPGRGARYGPMAFAPPKVLHLMLRASCGNRSMGRKVAMK